MIDGATSREDRFAAWCGWVLAGTAALTPLIAWLAPLAFAPLLAIAGVLTLPAVRITDRTRPMALALLATLVWAVISIGWSPYRPGSLGASTAFKLVLQVPVYWAAVCAAALASERSRTLGLRILAWGAALLGLLVLVEGLTGAAGFQAIRSAIGDPIRPDLAVAKVAQAVFVLALLTPAAAVAAQRAAGAPWLIIPMAAGVMIGGVKLLADAPPLALVLAMVAGLATLRWPRAAPWTLAGLSVIFFILTPLFVWLARKYGVYEPLQQSVSESWALRMGYWSKAVDWIGDHTLRGWGLDASRMFGPGIRLHPHDVALQLWLELGVVGAVGGSVLWATIFAGLSRPRPDIAVAASVGAGVVYLTFGAFSFGVWQEWWLALGALSAAACVAVQRQPARARSDAAAPIAVPSSTIEA